MKRYNTKSFLQVFSFFMTRKKGISKACILLFISLFLAAQVKPVYSASRSIRVVVNAGNKDESKEMPLYKDSYALLIGASNYRAGWPSLESVPGELSLVEKLLTNKGFNVEKHINPDSRELVAAFSGFINKYGYERENRLLFFYSGHGYTRLNGRKGYLVPVDAPDPDKNEKEFLTKALGMNQILSWARDIEAKHALFLFDSCFSGTVFKQKDRPSPPKHISMMTVEPVRQFITAGQAGETVPANSTFTPMFIDAVKFGLGDLNNDGYVSGTELGLYLQEKVPQHARQNPQFGKISDYDLSRGDFIFISKNVSPKLEPLPSIDYQSDDSAKAGKSNTATAQPETDKLPKSKQQVKIASIDKNKYILDSRETDVDIGRKTPRSNFMILINEKASDDDDMGNADKIITDYLLKRGAEVVDSQLIKAKIDVDQKLSAMTGSPQSAASLGMQFGADIVIIGKAIAKGSASQVRDSGLYSYQARVNLKAVKTSTAEIIDTDTATAAVLHVDDVIGTSMAIQSATSLIAERMLPGLINKTGASETGKPHKIRLIVNDVPEIWQVAAVKELLRKKIAGIQDVVQLSFVAGTANFDIYSQSDAQYLAEELSMAKHQHFTVSVIKVTGDKLVVKLTRTTP